MEMKFWFSASDQSSLAFNHPSMLSWGNIVREENVPERETTSNNLTSNEITSKEITSNGSTSNIPTLNVLTLNGPTVNRPTSKRSTSNGIISNKQTCCVLLRTKRNQFSLLSFDVSQNSLTQKFSTFFLTAFEVLFLSRIFLH